MATTTMIAAARCVLDCGLRNICLRFLPTLEAIEDLAGPESRGTSQVSSLEGTVARVPRLRGGMNGTARG
jgi:hypothetical protein